MVGNVLKSVGSSEPLFLVSLPVRFKLPEAIPVLEQVIFCPELPELSVFGFDELAVWGVLVCRPPWVTRRDHPRRRCI